MESCELAMDEVVRGADWRLRVMGERTARRMERRLDKRDGGAGKRTAGGDLPGDADGGNFIAQPREHDGAATGGEIPWIAGAGGGEAAGEGQRLLGLAAAGKWGGGAGWRRHRATARR